MRAQRSGPHLPTVAQPLQIHRYEWQDLEPTWQQHDAVWGGVVARGIITVRAGGTDLTVEAGMAYLVAPQVEVALKTPGDAVAEWRLYALPEHPPFATIQAAGGPELTPEPVRVLQAPIPTECERLSRLLDQPWQATAFWWHLASCQNQGMRGLHQRRRPPAWLQQAITACTSGHGLRRGVTGLALAARRSPSQVRRAVQASYGCTATDLVTHLRLERARYLLQHTDQTLAQIAQALGWRSSAWFSEVFASHHDGQSPGRWRASQDA